jgi:hypothetical protein
MRVLHVRWFALVIACCWFIAASSRAVLAQRVGGFSCEALTQALYGSVLDKGTGGAINEDAAVIKAIAESEQSLASREKQLDLDQRAEMAYVLQNGKPNAKLEEAIGIELNETKADRAEVAYYKKRHTELQSAMRSYRKQLRVRNCPEPKPKTATPDPCAPQSFMHSRRQLARSLLDQNCRKPQTASGWNGTWVAGNYTMTTGLSGTSLHVSFKGAWPGHSDSGTYSCTGVHGNTASHCTFSGTYKGPEKSVTRGGTATLSLGGSSISVTQRVTQANFAWTPPTPRPGAEGPSSMYPGSETSGTWTRKP